MKHSQSQLQFSLKSTPPANRKTPFLLLAGALISLLALSAQAQLAQPSPTPISPAANELLHQQQRQQQLRQQQERTPDVRLTPAQTSQGPELLPSAEVPCVVVKEITLVGDAAAQFQWAIAAASRTANASADPALGRCLGARGINLLMRRIQNAILARGFVAARVLAGQQSHLNSGQLELTLFPGRIHRIWFAPGTKARATLWNAIATQPGAMLNLRDIEQSLENFKRLPTVDADIQIVPAAGSGAAPGQSDLLIQWRQAFPFRVSLSADDAGTPATGKYQGAITFSYDHWWTLNDLFYISLNRNLDASAPGVRGNQGYTAHYSVPLGYWLLGLTASQSRYHQSVPGASQSYRYSGESQNGEIKLSRVIYRDALRKTSVSLSGWTRASKNFIDDTEVQVQRRRMAGFELGLSQRQFINRATLNASLNYRRGTGAWGSLPAPEQAFGEGTARPKIISAELQLNAPFQLGAQSLRYQSSWRIQWNKTPLVPQDRFAIGSRYSVRGFDGSNQLSAERGYFWRNDLALALGASGQELYLGLDYGEVAGPSSKMLIGKHLAGAVLGLRGGFKALSYDVFVSQPTAKPEGFQAAKTVAGFSVNWAF